MSPLPVACKYVRTAGDPRARARSRYPAQGIFRCGRAVRAAGIAHNGRPLALGAQKLRGSALDRARLGQVGRIPRHISGPSAGDVPLLFQVIARQNPAMPESSGPYLEKEPR